jgi:hypothetical protein
MRSLTPIALVSALFSFACGTDEEAPPPDDEVEAVFEVTSTDITLAPGDEKTFCFYFHTPNTKLAAVNKWVSDMTPGSHHMIYYASLGAQPPDGTIDECESNGVPIFGTQVAHEEVIFPTDDGAGKALAQDVDANTAGFFQMHYLNSTDSQLTAHVTLKAFALEEGLAYTKTDMFATYNNDIAIGKGATDVPVSATCDVPDAKFWSMSTHSHKQSTATKIQDGGAMVFQSTDWEHPGTERFDPAFFQFASGRVTWECLYDNTGDNADRVVTAGPSAQTDEMCMATGYYFPATGAKGCIVAAGQCLCNF